MLSLNKSRRIVLLGLLLVIALGLLIFTAVQTVQQIRSFQQHSRAVKAGDVETIRPWMTLHTVSHIYHVPEGYLNQELGFHNIGSNATLNTIAKTTHQPVNNVVQNVQHAVLKYRKTHSHASLPLIPNSESNLLSFQSRRREA